MNNWLKSSHLTEKEKYCQVCNYVYTGEERIQYKEDKIIKIKHIDCPRCGSTLILDVDKNEV